MKILIIGGTKFIGRELAFQAEKLGHEVVLFNRGITESSSKLPTIQGNVDELKAHKIALRKLNPDAVIHCIAYTERHAEDCVEIFAGSSAKILALSSQDCYEAFYQLNEGIDISENPIREDAPLCREKFYWKKRVGAKTYPDYDKNLMTAKLIKAFDEKKINTTVFRLPMVFGPNDPQFMYRHAGVVHHILDNRNEIVIGNVAQTEQFTYGYVDNIAAAVLHALDKPKTNGKVYNIGERTVRSRRRWIELFAEAARQTLNVRLAPDALIAKDAAAIDMRPRQMLFDTSLYSADTGFVEPVELSEQIKNTLLWAQNNREKIGAIPDYHRLHQIAECYSSYIMSKL